MTAACAAFFIQTVKRKKTQNKEIIIEFFIEWAGIVLIVWLAAASPGPDFIIAVRNSVLHSQRAGILTAIGIGLGVLVHVTYCILGIGAVINQSVMLFSIIKYVGAAYLIYIGIKALRSKGYDQEKIIGNDQNKNRADMPPLKALLNGFWTNVLNPKATLFFLALFTQVIDSETTLGTQIIYGTSAAFVITIWFSFVSIALNQRHVRRSFMASAKWIDRICGGLLVALGVKLALDKA